MSIPFIRANSGSISAFAKGRPVTIPPDHRFYEEALAALREGDEDRFVSLADLTTGITEYLGSTADDEDREVRVANGQVFYKGSAIHNTVTERILEFLKQGLPHRPLILFLENLMQNPSKHSVDQLYNFLENQKLPITEDGHFLAYKRVRDDWMDFHTQTINNSVGNTPKVDRNSVDDNWNNDCSNGLHVGSIDYVRGFNTGGHLIVVKVNPKDAVAVPQYATNKMRVCEYYVQEEVTLDSLGLGESLYRAEPGVPVAAVNPNPVPVLNTAPVFAIATDDEDDDDDEESSSDDDDEDWEESSSEEEEEEDSSEEEDDSSSDDSSDDDEDDEDDEDDDEDNSLPLSLWAEGVGLNREYLKDTMVQDAISQKDGVSVVQYLYRCVLRSNDLQGQKALENPLHKLELIRIVESL